MEYEELKAYLDRNLTLRQISAESKKSYTSVRHWMRKYGLKPNFANFKGGYKPKQKIDEEGKRYCPHCQTYKDINEFYSRRKTNCSGHCKECVRIQTVKRGRQLKLECVAYKGGKCQSCSYNKCQAALDFHHRNPEQKDFAICRRYGSRKINDRMRKELDKCDILCANCHREKHWDLNKSN